MFIEDTKTDPEFSSHPASAAFPNIGSYLGVPIFMSDGTFFGTLCAVDPEPRELTQYQADLLAVLARFIATTLERDRELEERRRAEQALRESEERFRSLVQYASDINAILEADGTVRYTSPAIQRVLGRQVEELVGRNAFDYVHPEDLEQVYATFIEAIDKPKATWRIEFRVRHADGSWHYLEAIGNNLLFEPSVKGVVLNARDTTERKQTEKALAELAAIVESSDDAILGKTLEGVITSWNSGAQRFYGYSGEEVIGRSISILVPPDRSEEVPRILETIRRGESIGHYETERITKAGSRVEVSITVSPVKDRAGNIVGASTIARDITERKEVEKKLAQALATQRAANEELERINKIRRDFVSVVSHEFRTALTGIQGFSQMMRDEDFTTEEIKEMSSDIYEDATRLNRMINEMLDLDRMESGRVTLDVERVDINEILMRVVNQVRSNASRHEIHLQLDEGIPELLADRDKLTQVLTNLLNNAIKYSPEGGKITVDSRNADEFAHVSVLDEGAGIRSEALEKLFEPYTRVESGATRYIQGTGLGLAISRQIIELHGGNIWAESELGVGSAFHFTVPLDGSRLAAVRQ